jgi:hypothetical protein
VLTLSTSDRFLPRPSCVRPALFSPASPVSGDLALPSDSPAHGRSRQINTMARIGRGGAPRVQARTLFSLLVSMLMPVLVQTASNRNLRSDTAATPAAAAATHAAAPATPAAAPATPAAAPATPAATATTDLAAVSQAVDAAEVAVDPAEPLGSTPPSDPSAAMLQRFGGSRESRPRRAKTALLAVHREIWKRPHTIAETTRILKNVMGAAASKTLNVAFSGPLAGPRAAAAVAKPRIFRSPEPTGMVPSNMVSKLQFFRKPKDTPVVDEKWENGKRGRISQATKDRVRLADPNGGVCIFTNDNSKGLSPLDVCHILPRATPPRDVCPSSFPDLFELMLIAPQLKNLQFGVYGHTEKLLHPDTRHNILPGE